MDRQIHNCIYQQYCIHYFSWNVELEKDRTTKVNHVKHNLINIPHGWLYHLLARGIVTKCPHMFQWKNMKIWTPSKLQHKNTIIPTLYRSYPFGHIWSKSDFLCLCSTTSIHVHFFANRQMHTCYWTTNDVVQCTSPKKRNIVFLLWKGSSYGIPRFIRFDLVGPLSSPAGPHELSLSDHGRGLTFICLIIILGHYWK